MINISVLGSTGSIGTQTLDVLEAHPRLLTPLGFSAGSNINLLSKQIKHFSPQAVSVRDEQTAIDLSKILSGKKPEIFWGDQGNCQIATLSNAERVVIATPGLPGIKPTLEAIKKGKLIALATKEVLVAAGEVIIQAAKTHNSVILPLDSEHSAIFQCLEGRSIEEVSKIILTCSGGPFRGLKGKDLRKVTVEQALKHPRWTMGQKISIDSATLMNKGFEVLEAHWLFGIPLEKIKVVVHPQSIIHSAVEFVDGTIIAQLGPADMRLPIQFALFYPEKRQSNSFKRFTFDDYPNLTFEHPDKETFKCLQLAYDVGKAGGTAPAVLNAANDQAVEAFIAGKLPFYAIPEVLVRTLSQYKSVTHPDIDQIYLADSWARDTASKIIDQVV